jgi:hypothetical protein
MDLDHGQACHIKTAQLDSIVQEILQGLLPFVKRQMYQHTTYDLAALKAEPAPKWAWVMFLRPCCTPVSRQASCRPSLQQNFLHHRHWGQCRPASCHLGSILA